MSSYYPPIRLIGDDGHDTFVRMVDNLAGYQVEIEYDESGSGCPTEGFIVRCDDDGDVVVAEESPMTSPSWAASTWAVPSGFIKEIRVV